MTLPWGPHLRGPSLFIMLCPLPSSLHNAAILDDEYLVSTDHRGEPERSEVSHPPQHLRGPPTCCPSHTCVPPRWWCGWRRLWPEMPGWPAHYGYPMQMLPTERNLGKTVPPTGRGMQVASRGLRNQKGPCFALENCKVFL